VEDGRAAGKERADGACLDCDPGSLHRLGQDAQCMSGGKTKRLEHCMEKGSACWQGQCLPLCEFYDLKQPLSVNRSGGVCCERPGGKLEGTGVNDCGEAASGVYRPWAFCAEPVGCRTPDGTQAELPRGTCSAAGGEELGPDQCALPTCCEGPNLEFAVVPLAQCIARGNIPVADAICETADCSRTGPAEFIPADAPACAAAGGIVTSGLLCGPQEQVTVQADVTLHPTGECTYQPWLAVPSSLNDSMRPARPRTGSAFRGSGDPYGAAHPCSVGVPRALRLGSIFLGNHGQVAASLVRAGEP
jgi:hypothetical protein